MLLTLNFSINVIFFKFIERLDLSACRIENVDLAGLNPLTIPSSNVPDISNLLI